MISDLEVAKITHEVNKVYCESLGDFSQPPWEDAPDWQRDSTVAGVQAVRNETAKSPEEQHESWMALKISEGWVYGPIKDAEKKTHPCLLPYSELPDDQKLKDHLFRAVALACAGATAAASTTA